MYTQRKSLHFFDQLNRRSAELSKVDKIRLYNINFLHQNPSAYIFQILFSFIVVIFEHIFWYWHCYHLPISISKTHYFLKLSMFDNSAHCVNSQNTIISFVYFWFFGQELYLILCPLPWKLDSPYGHTWQYAKSKNVFANIWHYN